MTDSARPASAVSELDLRTAAFAALYAARGWSAPERDFFADEAIIWSRFVGFLDGPAKLGNELIIGAGAACFANVRGHGRARAKQLLSQNAHFFTVFRQLDV